jgi:hypothetical protein
MPGSIAMNEGIHGTMIGWRGRRAENDSGVHAISGKRRRERGSKVSPLLRIQCSTLIVGERFQKDLKN